ncbi:FAD-dependent 5-carboxymethylaminomethyl-2-thiouridine(34) oxidoreductase MnmC [Allopusillimonas ginsengisoli]|uniref:FAD-dependent 5-carboxymethylaminomethyl-2-thiouridine(34) oxidoreductase MnmC n=1 Tax=Allopusillimonas ginsengisoli TaxID=453575 RepID=UPI001FD6CB61|nr:FAD-dependent 5-carboxymethylaminomethyl-2-thiouridine(34) oxidoreductase MnmC [Allopusillimonas ginsengisoli]
MSRHYGDIYHPQAGAIQQARNIFIGGNRLHERWRGLASFTVCETGFGLGNNFLALWQAWRSDANRPARLHMVSIEAHPFEREDLHRLLLRQHDGAMRQLALALVDAWPPLLPGMHRLEFEGGALTLTLAFGPVSRVLRQVQAQVDAFFLDGFAPRVNPDMWTPAVFGQLTRLAAKDATVATWCCVGQMRRDLRDAGFLVQKAPGFNGKREITIARLRPELGRRREPPGVAAPQPVLIVGGGLAGAGVAHSLALRGHEAHVFDPVFELGLAASHRGHHAAALSPVISRDDDIRARLSRAGVLRALQRWGSLPGQPLLSCGTLDLALDEDDARARREALAFLRFPETWVRWLDADQASRQAGLPLRKGGLFFPHGQCVRLAPLLEALLGRPGVQCHAATIAALRRDEHGQWAAMDENGCVLGQAPQVVLANARHAAQLMGSVSGMPAMPDLPGLRGIYGMAGQVSYYCEGDVPNSRTILAGAGYILPALEGRQLAGSTYVLDDKGADVTESGRRQICDKLEALLGMPVGALADVPTQGGWAGWRAAVNDRLPLIGPVGGRTGLWLACAYGSRGLSWSGLAGDVIGATLNREPLPLERELLAKIAAR